MRYVFDQSCYKPRIHSNDHVFLLAHLFVELTETEQQIVDILKQKNNLPIDDLCIESDIAMGKMAGILLNLEFKNVVKSLPGKVYALAN